MKLGRLMVAMITPFTAAGEVNYKEAGRIARWLVERGHEGLVVAGTTGESPTLSDDEKLRLFAAVKEAVGAQTPVVAGTTNNDTRDSADFTQRVDREGVADAILAVVPYYNKPTQDGLLGHFGAIAQATRLPVILYNIPGRTGANMLPETTIELAHRHANIVGVKESSGDFAQFSQILRARPDTFMFWSGDDMLTLPSLALGGDGIISVASHICGPQMREMLDAYERGDITRAAELHLSLSPLFEALFATTNPIPVKWAMGRLGFEVGTCRLPLGAMPESLATRVEALLAPYLRETARV